ncbi:MAG: MBG domain-containing protein, partial [Clostridia bacterium]|nr:MBG domain-containing protein [Clostridia bacterium]
MQSYLGDATQGHIEFGQTLLSQTDIMLGHLSPTAIYKIGNQNTTISGRFVFETEAELAARYSITLITNANGESVLPVRYDRTNTVTVISYTVYLYWEAGDLENEVFERNHNYDIVRYEVSITVARATPDFSEMYFDEIIYGETLQDSELLGKPFAPATGPQGLPLGSYLINYDPFTSIVYPKGDHMISCTFTPQGEYLNNYRKLNNVAIPLTVTAKQVHIDLPGANRSLVYGTGYQVPECDVYYETPQGTHHFHNPDSILDYSYRDTLGNVVNISTTMGLVTYVSAVPGTYTLTITVTSNDYSGSLTVNDFLIRKGTLSIVSDPTQEIVEYGELIGNIDFYNGRCQNVYTRVSYTGSFSLVPEAGDDTFVPEADRQHYSVVRQIKFVPTDSGLYDYYEEFIYSWTYKINKNSKDVSIVPKADTLNAVYDGTEKPVDFDISYPAGSSATIKEATTTKYYSQDGQIEYTRIPRDAGTYRVVIAVNEDFLNFYGSITTSLTIAKQPINIAFAERYHVFTGESQGFGDIDFSGYVGDQGAIQYTIQYFRYTGATMYMDIPVDVGKYIARITINENNFSGTADINYYIIPSAITVSGWYGIYDDTEKEISVSVEPSLVDYTIKYRPEQRNDEGDLIGAFTDAKPRDAGRYQVRISINENGYYKEIDIFNAVLADGNLYDDANKLTILQNYPDEYAQKVEEGILAADYPLFLRIAKAYAVMTVSETNQNKSVVYDGSANAIIASFTPNYLVASYSYTPCQFEIVEGEVVPILINGQPVPLTDTSSVVFDSYNRPVSVGYYVLTITLTDKDYQLGAYVKPTLTINPASLIIDTMPAVSGNIYYKQTEAVQFIEDSGQVRFAAMGITVKGVWELASDISNFKVGTYGNISVRFIPMLNGEPDINFVPPIGSITISIAKKDIGEYIYFTNGDQVLDWADGVVIAKPYTQLQITCTAWLDTVAANIEPFYNNGRPLTLRVKYNGTYTAPTNVGSYSIVAEISDSNYYGQSLTGTLLIERAEPAVIPPEAASIPVGAALSQSALTSGLAYIASSVNEDNLRSIAGSFTFLSPDRIMDRANYQKVWVVFTPADLTTYDIHKFQIEILIKGIDVSVAGVSATELVYGQPLRESVLSYTGSTVPGSIQWYDENAIVDVGATARYMFIPDNPDVYNIIYDGQVAINIAKAEMDYDANSLLIKGYVGETLGDAANHVTIDLWHTANPQIKVADATFSIEDIDPSEVIYNSKEVYDCRLVVTHPNYHDVEIYATIKTYVYLGGENFFITNTCKQYDGESVTIEDLGLKLVGTPEQLDLSLFQMRATKNGIEVSEINETGVYDVEISVFDDMSGDDITMAYDGICNFVYTINKKVFDGSGTTQSNQIYLKGNSTVYGGAAGDVQAYFQYKKYHFVVSNRYKIYDGSPLTIDGLGILLLNSSEQPDFIFTEIRKLSTVTQLYETVQAVEMEGQYLITLSLGQNVLLDVTDAPLASVEVPFTVLATEHSDTEESQPYTIAYYVLADETQVKLTYFSEDKSIEYGQSAPTSAGDYVVEVTFLAASPYFEGKQEFSYTVAPMVIYVTLESVYSFEYGQNIVVSPMFTAAGTSGTTLSNIGYNLQYYISSGGDWILLNETPVNAGNYRVRVVLTGTDYVLAEGEGIARLDITQLQVLISQTPTLSNITYGQELYNSVIFNGEAVLEKTDEEISGVWRFKEPDKNDLSAGERTATVVFVPDNANYETVEITGVSIQVLKASASIECLELSLPYNGLEQQPIIRTNPVTNLTVNFSYYQYVHGQEQGVGKPRAAGNYIVKMTISDGNYQGSAEADFIITKAVISQENVVVPTVGSLTYGQSLSYAAFVGGSATNPASNSKIAGAFQFTYRGLTLLGKVVELGGVTGSSNPYGFQVYQSPDGSISDILGVYTHMPYRFVPADTANYEIFESTIPVTLMKATASITVYDSASMKYGNMTSFVYGDNMPELTFLTSPMGLVVSNPQYMGENGLFNTIPKAGSYMYTARINDSNYKGELIYSVSVNKRKAQIEFIDDDGQITDWYSYTFASTKHAMAQIVSSSLLSEDLQRKEEIETGLSYRYMLRDSSSNIVMHKLPDNVGEYIVYAVLENDDYYIDSEALKPNYDITKATVEYLDFDSSTLINLIYGKVQIPSVVTRPDNISYKISFPGYPSMPTTAGTHRIKVVVDDPNFYPAEKSSMFYIYKKDISIDNIKVVNRPYDGTDVVQITGELTGLVLNDEVRLNMTARTANGATEPGVYDIEILTWELSGLHASNYSVRKPAFNGTVKINQKVISDPKSNSYITSEDGFSSNVTVSFEKVVSAQNQTTLFSKLLGQSAIVQTITIKELGLVTELDRKVKFHVLIPEEYRDSPTLQVEALDELSQHSISFTR